MKKVLLLTVIFFLGCNQFPSEQKKSESLAKLYLTKANSKISDFKIIKFGDVHPVFNSYVDDAHYPDLKNNKSKVDSLRQHFKPKVTSWVIYVEFRGIDNYGNLGVHYYQCWIDKKLDRCYASIEVDRIY
ncbi:MAG: hypothetical protein ACTHJ8_04815 [Mucilaginibacter sp.]